MFLGVAYQGGCSFAGSVKHLFAYLGITTSSIGLNKALIMRYMNNPDIPFISF